MGSLSKNLISNLYYIITTTPVYVYVSAAMMWTGLVGLCANVMPVLSKQLIFRYHHHLFYVWIVKTTKDWYF